MTPELRDSLLWNYAKQLSTRAWLRLLLVDGTELTLARTEAVWVWEGGKKTHLYCWNDTTARLIPVDEVEQAHKLWGLEDPIELHFTVNGGWHLEALEQHQSLHPGTVSKQDVPEEMLVKLALEERIGRVEPSYMARFHDGTILFLKDSVLLRFIHYGKLLGYALVHDNDVRLIPYNRKHVEFLRQWGVHWYPVWNKDISAVRIEEATAHAP